MKDEQQPTTILVTGANGQLGQTISELYAKNNLGLEFTFVSKEKFDITNEDAILTYFRNNKFDYCINCAAYTNVEQAEKIPKIAFKVNAEGVKWLAKACKQTNTIFKRRSWITILLLERLGCIVKNTDIIFIGL